MIGSVDFAILAPVPEVLLDSGKLVAASEGFVAYGSRKWELFREVDRIRDDEPVPMLIYPSREDVRGKLTFIVAWKGWYVGHVESVLGGAHPDGGKYRPPHTTDEDRGIWAVFWHVKELELLPKEQRQPISSLHSYKTGYWRMNHPPLGPEIVARPSWI